MELKVKKIDMCSDKYVVLLNETDAKELSVHSEDRIKIKYKGEEQISIVITSKNMVGQGFIGVPPLLFEELSLEEGKEISVIPSSKPRSIGYIKKKINGKKLTKDEIYTLIHDITNDALSDIELSSYITAVYIRGCDLDETEWMTRAMVDTGDEIHFDDRIFDVHSIGGVPGNKYALLTVPIVAAQGLKIPKTSTRAISSAAGTADVMDVLTNVELDVSKIKMMLDKIGGVLAWGGSVNLAPADDKIVKVEKPMGLDPHYQVLASVLAKKKATGVTSLVIDLPIGEGTKILDEEMVGTYARDFIELGKRLGINVECVVTYGGQPVGRAIGPALEAKEGMMALEGKWVSRSLIDKATKLAGIILEMGGVAKRNEGTKLALETLKSGEALKKFLEIIDMQGSEGITKSDDIPLGKYTSDIISRESGYIQGISNSSLVKIAKAAGAPKNKGAGIWLYKKNGHQVEKDEKIFTIYADSKLKLDYAVKLANQLKPIKIVGMVLDRIPSYH